MEEKGLRVNAGKTKIMIFGTGLDLLQSSGKFPCAVCRTGVGSNSIFCKGCKHRLHKKCSGLKRLTEDPDYRCTRCQGTTRSLDGRPQREVQVRPDKLEVGWLVVLRLNGPLRQYFYQSISGHLPDGGRKRREMID